MAAGDTSHTLGTYWKTTLDSVIAGEHDPPPRGADELEAARKAVLAEKPEGVLQPGKHVPGDTAKLSAAIEAQRAEVKQAFGNRKASGRIVPSADVNKAKVKYAMAFDESKLLRMEAEMSKRFADKVAPPAREIRMPRRKEMEASRVTEFSCGNELFDKCDYLAALAEYELAAEVPHVRLFALINRGNAFKALNLVAEAIACYQDVLDEASLSTPDGRIIHSYALNNLGAVCQDDLRFEQALQYLSSAVALNPKAHIALRNRANLHLAYSEELRAAEATTLVPPQYELALGLYAASMEQDWQLPVVFEANEVLVRSESRVTSSREEPSASLTRNAVYHFTSNRTHTTCAHV